MPSGLSMFRNTVILSIWRAFFPSKSEKQNDISFRFIGKNVKKSGRPFDIDWDLYNELYGKDKKPSLDDRHTNKP